VTPCRSWRGGGGPRSRGQHRAAHRRSRKEKAQMGNDFDDFSSLNTQLGTLGLTLKQIPGDGNCLFRALGDQLHGNSNDHFLYRTKVVNYMRQNRQDFEPFVEDDISFDSHLSSLAESGTFAGNDSIVAFARLHDITVVIHQLNKPLWQIHGGREGRPGGSEVHISYHNGDHYNSVRRLGHCAASPSRISLCLVTDCDNYRPLASPPDISPDSGQESDYENSPSHSNLDRLASEVASLAGVDVKREVFDALEVNAYCVSAAVDYLINDAVTVATSNLWRPGGTGARIFGEQTAHRATVTRTQEQRAHEKLANMQQKLQNKNLSNKKRKELKKHQRKLLSTEKKRSSNANVHDTHNDETELVRANVQALTI